jgi:phospholipid/cholesterol/gamma-HCH transport system substrate-binding protein
MLKYRGARLMRAGFIGIALIVMVIAVGLSPERIIGWATTVRYQAVFFHAGGLVAGNEVKVSGVKVGSVSDVALQAGKALVTFTVDATVPLGSETTAHIRTGSLLGQRVLTLESSGSSTIRPNTVIPLSRTGSPYSLTDAIGEFTTSAAGTDTAALNQSLDTLAATLDQIAPQLGPAFDAVSRLSRSINSRDETLAELLRHTGTVTDVLAKRSEQLNALILNANDLVTVLAERRQAIVDLLANTSAVAQQVSGLVADNEKQLAPTLEKLNSVTAMLEKNRDNIAKALPGLAKYQVTQGETVANGWYYNAYIPNLALPEILQPFLDYAFGFRRGTNQGQPPDNAGPRAEIPFPYNGIPQPGDLPPR